jgi:hypothetical protein
MTVRLTSKRWHALEVRRGKECAAAVFVATQWPGSKVCIPLDVRPRVMPAFAELTSFLRFSPYMFAQFPSHEAGALTGQAAEDAGIISVVPNALSPYIVPDKVIDALKAWKPQPKNVRSVGRQYQPGEVVTVYLTAGKPQQGVITAFDKGRGRAKVQIWFLGAQRIIPVPISALEPDEQERARA